MSSLKGKVIVITGASSGIGEGIAIHFAGLGAKLTLAGRNKENLNRVAELCLKEGSEPSEILTVQGDINNEEHRKDLVQKCIEKFQGIDVLINNAGIIYYVKTLDTSAEQFDTMLNTNVRSPLFLTQLVVPFLKASKGAIVNISSLCGPLPMPAVGAYCMTKAAFDSFTRCLSLARRLTGSFMITILEKSLMRSIKGDALTRTELAPFGVRVNSINPGTIVSNIARREHGAYQDDELYEKFLATSASLHPLGRVGQPKDCAEAAAFLASDSASFITGQLLYVDGGRNCVSATVRTDVTK